MDDPALPPADHDRALAGLARLNALSRASAPVARALKRTNLPREPHILDVATGSGDVALALARSLSRAGLAPRFTLADLSDHALARAAKRFRRAKIDATTITLDATTDDLPRADAVICTLFLHHLTEDDARALLANAARAATRVLAVADLRRSRPGSILARTVPRLVTRSPVVHTDAAKSADAALTREELAEIAKSAGLAGFTISSAFPSRMLLTWSPPTTKPTTPPSSAPDPPGPPPPSPSRSETSA